MHSTETHLCSEVDTFGSPPPEERAFWTVLATLLSSLWALYVTAPLLALAAAYVRAHT